jgi:hypothetical protein
MNTMASRLLSTFAALAAGLVTGVSFLAQPAKFGAADVPLAHLVSAGSAIFHTSHTAQAVVLPMLAVVALAARRRDAASWVALAGATAALAAQAALMPIFDARVLALTRGEALAPQPLLHIAYVVLELGKVAALLTLAWRTATPAAMPRGAWRAAASTV